MDIYLFGSLCRGEIDEYSDVDLLAIIGLVENNTTQLDQHKFSIYQEKRIVELWKEGNPFAWHLFKESKFIFSDNDIDILTSLGKPKPYTNMKADLDKFSNLFYSSINSLKDSKQSDIFDLSMLFLSIRNFASCYSLGYLNDFNFSRDSALKLKHDKLNISEKTFKILERARILSTRGSGKLITNSEIKEALKETETISSWFQLILNKV